jgi:hypothetical protein
MHQYAEGCEFWRKREDYLEAMPPAKLRFLQRVTDLPDQPKTAEELTLRENLEAISAAFYVIGRALTLILWIFRRQVAAYFSERADQSRLQRWAQLGTSAAFSAVGVVSAPALSVWLGF